jgi:hypothetical protein
MSREIRNSSVPPAMRKEFREIPMRARNCAPTSANRMQIPSEIADAFAAMSRL